MLVRLPTLMMGNDGLWTDDGGLIYLMCAIRAASPPGGSGIRPDVCTFGEKVLPPVLADSNRVDVWRRFEYRSPSCWALRPRCEVLTNDTCHEPCKINDVTVRTSVTRMSYDNAFSDERTLATEPVGYQINRPSATSATDFAAKCVIIRVGIRGKKRAAYRAWQ